MSKCSSCKPCCLTGLDPKGPNDVEPIFVDFSEWVQSVGSIGIVSGSMKVQEQSGNKSRSIVVLNLNGSNAAVEVDTSSCDKPEPLDLKVSDFKISRMSSVVEAKLTDGKPGVLYHITVFVETCEGLKKEVCISQYIGDC